MARSPQRWREAAREALARGDADRLERACAAILKAEPTDLEARVLLARRALLDHEFSVAQNLLNEAAALNPSEPAAWTELARAYAQQRRLAEAEACLATAEASGVRTPGMLTFLGRLRLALKREDAARIAFETAADMAPGHADAYRGLALTEGLSEGSSAHLKAEQLAASNTPSIASAAAYALAEGAHRNGDHGAFLTWLARANAHQARMAQEERRARQMKQVTHALDRLKRAQERSVRSNAVATEPAMVFILGEPGNGAVLVEQALAREAHVSFGGQTGILLGAVAEEAQRLTKRPAALAGSRLKRPQRIALAREYLRRHEALAYDPEPIASDSDPSVLWAAPLALALFANAAFVRVERDPADAALAVWAHADPSHARETCDLTALNQHRRKTSALLDALEAVAPMVRASYEDFHANPGRAARALAKKLGAPERAAPPPADRPSLSLLDWDALQAAQRITPGAAHGSDPALTALRDALALAETVR